MSLTLKKKLTTTIAGILAIVLVQFLGLTETAAETTSQMIAGMVGAFVLGQGIADAGKEKVLAAAKTAVPVVTALLMVVLLAGCITAPQEDTLDSKNKAAIGEGNKDVTSSLFHSVATTRQKAEMDGENGKDRNGGEVLEPTVINVYDANGVIIGQQLATWTDEKGKIHVATRRVTGFRDFNNFVGVNTFTSTASGSGTTDGQSTQGNTPTTGAKTSTPTVEVPVEVTVPATTGP